MSLLTPVCARAGRVRSWSRALSWSVALCRYTLPLHFAGVSPAAAELATARVRVQMSPIMDGNLDSLNVNVAAVRTSRPRTPPEPQPNPTLAPP